MEPLTVSGKLESLGAIAQYVMSAAKEAGLEKKAAYKLRLAIDEVTTNIITHGYEEADLEGDIYLAAKIDKQALTISVEDTAIAYDPTEKKAVEQELLNAPLEEKPIGGLGVFLALDGVDNFLYERSGDRNRNIFVVNRPTN